MTELQEIFWEFGQGLGKAQAWHHWVHRDICIMAEHSKLTTCSRQQWSRWLQQQQQEVSITAAHRQSHHNVHINHLSDTACQFSVISCHEANWLRTTTSSSSASSCHLLASELQPMILHLWTTSTCTALDRYIKTLWTLTHIMYALGLRSMCQQPISRESLASRNLVGDQAAHPVCNH